MVKEMVKKAILIVGHGSRYEYNKKLMLLQKDRLESMGFDNVYIGFNETSHPFIEESMGQMAADGVDEVIAIPFFIASGIHMTRDIPKKLGLTAEIHDTVTEEFGRRMAVHFDEPFGEDPVLARILKEMVDDVKRSDRCGIMIIGHGSKLEYNSNIIKLNAKRLSDMGYENVRYAFNEFNDPTIETVLEEMLDSGVEEVLVLPLFMSLGDHLKNDVPPKIHLVDGMPEGTYSHKGRDVRICYLPPVGSDPRLTEIFAAKARAHL